MCTLCMCSRLIKPNKGNMWKSYLKIFQGFLNILYKYIFFDPAILYDIIVSGKLTLTIYSTVNQNILVLHTHSLEIFDVTNYESLPQTQLVPTPYFLWRQKKYVKLIQKCCLHLVIKKIRDL